MLGEVSPHGCGLPWPETIERVAEWCGRNAGCRSAGLGSKGGTRAHTHAVGVRAQRNWQDLRAVCSAVVHRFGSAVRNYEKFGIGTPLIFVNSYRHISPKRIRYLIYLNYYYVVVNNSL